MGTLRTKPWTVHDHVEWVCDYGGPEDPFIRCRTRVITNPDGSHRLERDVVMKAELNSITLDLKVST